MANRSNRAGWRYLWIYDPVQDDRSDFTHSHIHYKKIQAHGTCKPLFSSVKPYSHTMFTCVSNVHVCMLVCIKYLPSTRGPDGQEPSPTTEEREFLIANLLVRIHLII